MIIRYIECDASLSKDIRYMANPNVSIDLYLKFSLACIIVHCSSVHNPNSKQGIGPVFGIALCQDKLHCYIIIAIIDVSHYITTII